MDISLVDFELESNRLYQFFGELQNANGKLLFKPTLVRDMDKLDENLYYLAYQKTLELMKDSIQDSIQS